MDTLKAYQAAAIGLGLCFIAYKFIPSAPAKTVALGAAGAILAANLPVIQDAM